MPTLSEIVGEIADGTEVFFGGFGYSQPFAAAHECIRQDVSDLRVVRASGDVLLDQLVGAGCVSEAVISHCWNAVGPTPTHAFRRAVERAEPQPLAVEEFGLGDLVLRLSAGARDLPFIPTTAKGTGAYHHRLDDGKYDRVEAFGDRHDVMAPLRPELGFVHVHRADRRGNAQLSGPAAELRYGAMACDRLVVTTEEIVAPQVITPTPESTFVPGFLVDEVLEVPGGAHPSGVLDRYGRDVAYLAQYGRETETSEGFASFLDTWVYGVEDREDYLERLVDRGFEGVDA